MCYRVVAAMNISQLPTINAILNAITGVLLVLGYIQIRKGNRAVHKKIMLTALTTSFLFLISYLTYHFYAGSVPYPYHDWTRPVYYIILVPHVILAGIMLPFIVIAVWHALHENFAQHRRFVRWVFPVWMYVSVTGVIIYLMLYRF